MSCSFSLILLFRSAIILLNSKMMRALVRMLEGGAPLDSFQSASNSVRLLPAVPELGAEFRYLRLQLVSVLVENGSTPPGRKRRKRRRRLSPFIGRIIRRI